MIILWTIISCGAWDPPAAAYRTWFYSGLYSWVGGLTYLGRDTTFSWKRNPPLHLVATTIIGQWLMQFDLSSITLGIACALTIMVTLWTGVLLA